jgi:hypothetical protein
MKTLMQQRWRVLVLGILLAWLASPAPALAHVGAPYPVLLEEPVGPYVASALADPDIGTGTFYILVALPGGELPPLDTTVTVWVQPEDNHLPETGHPADRQQTRYGERFVAEVPFDAQGPWQVRLVIDGSGGSGETSFPVKVTPSGIGWVATLACLLPFVLLGALWLRGIQRLRTAP